MPFQIWAFLFSDFSSLEYSLRAEPKKVGPGGRLERGNAAWSAAPQGNAWGRAHGLLPTSDHSPADHMPPQAFPAHYLRDYLKCRFLGLTSLLLHVWGRSPGVCLSKILTHAQNRALI